MLGLSLWGGRRRKLAIWNGGVVGGRRRPRSGLVGGTAPEWLGATTTLLGVEGDGGMVEGGRAVGGGLVPWGAAMVWLGAAAAAAI